ncbi:MAG: hypothetical protein GEV06_28460 [Luteitalea sp.]|nr:hypothetical protein [Luteitalea sp.]
MKIVHVGYFERPEDTLPTFDPGMDVPCPICGDALSARPRTSISVLPDSGARSLFFRAHRSCWRDASRDVQHDIESQVVDLDVARKA